MRARAAEKAEEAWALVKLYQESNDKVGRYGWDVISWLILLSQDMEAQGLLNVNFVSAHEQLQTNINPFWGPEQAPFAYTTSKWGRESSVEMSSNSDNSYQTPPVVGSLQWDQLQEVPPSGEVGETLQSPKSWKSLSSIRSQPCVLPYRGLMRILRQHGHQEKGKLVKASWTNSSKKSMETGTSGLLKRARSPTPLEYALDH